MYLIPFRQIFPEQGIAETRVLHATGYPGLPDDEYGLFESYCPDPGCDCRRVLLQIVGRRQGGVLAWISFGFDRNDDLAGPFLDPLNPQSRYAKLLLVYVAPILADPAYVARLESHYHQFKKVAGDPKHPMHERLVLAVKEDEVGQPRHEERGKKGVVDAGRRTSPAREYSNRPTGHDRARVAGLKPIHEAIDRLPIPPIRSRKVGGILDALELQIEDGGDHPGVNRTLLVALRAGVLHQVDERYAGEVLRAIDAFEKAEAERWERIRAGAPPPAASPPEDRLPPVARVVPFPQPPGGQPVSAGKPGRNDPCWCGSGKKYKRCHLQADEEAGRR